MEWYAAQFFQDSVSAASFFGAFQLIVLAGIWIFKIPLPKPVKSRDPKGK
jgi:hypothetical protein